MRARAYAGAFRKAESAAAHNQPFQNFILFEHFQIALPLKEIGIILRATGADPVGVRQYPTVSCRRKRLPTPEGESKCLI